MNLKNVIFLGDHIEIMKTFPDNFLDMILTDLPYNITRNSWEQEINLDLLWKEYKRILKQNGVIALTASQPFTSKLVLSNLEMYKHEWIWQKNRGSNFANTIREPFKEHESILIFSKGKWIYNKQMQERAESGLNRIKYDFNHVTETENYNKFNKPSDSKGKNLRVPSSIQKFNVEVGLHPTQKPISLFEYLIKTYTNEEDLILDSCAGSGTTAIACKNLNRNYILIEKELKYYDIIINRISKYEKN